MGSFGEGMPAATPRTRAIRTGLCLGVALLGITLAGCEKKPGGQVIAVVNNEEITQQELRTEAEASNLPAAQGSPAATAALLQRVIDRNILADYARDQGMDREPDYLARRRQLEQTLLANLAMRKLAGPQSNPTPAQVKNFIESQPTLFAQRQRLTLDQIRFPTPTDSTKIDSLTKLGTIDAIAQNLTANGVQFTRGTPVLDTGTLDPAIAKQIVVLPNGELFDLSADGTTTFSSVTARASAATPADSWTAPATEAVRRNVLDKTLQTALEKLRRSAKIRYDAPFQPPAKSSAPTKTAPTATP